MTDLFLWRQIKIRIGLLRDILLLGQSFVQRLRQLSIQKNHQQPLIGLLKMTTFIKGQSTTQGVGGSDEWEEAAM